ncbi:MAG: hypothetical protein K6T90_02375 [Leptolyngbyaceae cyanobacterium HOT.MB2.61]|nr:hypothetical protein [Leptolyngbyaceae cyanobacterium HOT.MB2.61]
MTPRTNTKPHPKVPESPKSPASNPYAPSVPISLYREVTTELQTAKTRLESLRLQNQELLEQNQRLRVEIERVVQSALHLRQLADTHETGRLPASDSSLPDVEIHFESPPPQPVAPGTTRNEGVELSPPKNPLFTERPSQPRRRSDSPRSSDIGGWWLVLAILVIVVTAFGTGFLIVRPLLPSR